jgi:hypothetical protein
MVKNRAKIVVNQFLLAFEIKTAPWGIITQVHKNEPPNSGISLNLHQALLN